MPLNWKPLITIFTILRLDNPAGAKHKTLLENLAQEKKKNEQLMLRTCRESVCEMILEPIVDFTREGFVSDRDGADKMTWDLLLSKALQLETTAHNFYVEAAEKFRALPEVSRALESVRQPVVRLIKRNCWNSQNNFSVSAIGHLMTSHSQDAYVEGLFPGTVRPAMGDSGPRTFRSSIRRSVLQLAGVARG